MCGVHPSRATMAAFGTQSVISCAIRMRSPTQQHLRKRRLHDFQPISDEFRVLRVQLNANGMPTVLNRNGECRARTRERIENDAMHGATGEDAPASEFGWERSKVSLLVRLGRDAPDRARVSGEGSAIPRNAPYNMASFLPNQISVLALSVAAGNATPVAARLVGPARRSPKLRITLSLRPLR